MGTCILEILPGCLARIISPGGIQDFWNLVLRSTFRRFGPITIMEKGQKKRTTGIARFIRVTTCPLLFIQYYCVKLDKTALRSKVWRAPKNKVFCKYYSSSILC
jgi:hypothetical protein